jgi:hypothetical protein
MTGAAHPSAGASASVAVKAMAAKMFVKSPQVSSAKCRDYSQELHF